MNCALEAESSKLEAGTWTSSLNVNEGGRGRRGERGDSVGSLLGFNGVQLGADLIAIHDIHYEYLPRYP